MTTFRRLGVAVGLAGVAGLAGLAGLACGDDGGTDPMTGTIAVSVTADGEPLSGATVELFEPGGAVAVATSTTGSSGGLEFDGVEPGSYEVELEVPAGLELAVGETARRSVTVGEGGRVSVSFTLESGTAGNVMVIRLTSSLRFDPAEVTIEPGTTVRWENAANIFHTITPDGHSEWERATVSQSGDTFTHTFEATGTFPYYCEPHRGQGMTGTITVQ